MAQPTLGRQVRALEDELGVILFERVGRGLTLTPSGLELVDHVRAMSEAASRVSLTASGQSQSIEGTVCVSATEVAAAYVLPPIVTRLRRAEPGIAIEIVASNSISDLLRREADIAVRSVRPTDPDLIARKLTDGVACLYAAPDYIERSGGLEGPADLSKAEFIGFEDNEAYMTGLATMGLAVTARNFAITTGSHLVHWELVKNAAGIGVMATHIGDAEPGVQRVAPWLEPFRYETWLVAHRELNTSRRVRLVFDWLVEALS